MKIHWKRSIVPAPLLLMALCAGCAGHRPQRTQAELIELRKMHDAQYVRMGEDMVRRLVEAVKLRYDKNPGASPMADILVISGGGDWGAFGAGFLKGWSRVEGPMAKPKFDAVTGVSTGALISPFAFLGDEESIDTIETLVLVRILRASIVHCYVAPH